MRRDDAHILFFIVCLALFVPATAVSESGEAANDSDTSKQQEANNAKSSEGVPADVKSLSDDNKIIGAADYAAFRKTAYHERLFDWISRQQGTTDVRKDVAKELGFDPDKSLERIAFGVPTGQLGTTPRDLEAFTVVLNGTFDNETVLKAIRKQRQQKGDDKDAPDLETVQRPGPWTVYSGEDAEFAFTDSGEITVVRGDKRYADTAWKAAAGNAPTAVDAVDAYGGFEPVDRERLLWMVKRSKDSQSPQSEDLIQTAASVDLDEGLWLQVVSIAEDAKAAKATEKRFKSISETQGSTAMLAMIGAGPLVQNLSVSRSGNTVTATSSMTKQQFDAMIAAIGEMMQSRDKLNMPGGASGGSKNFEPEQPDSSSKKKSPSDGDDSTDSRDSDDGGADFN